MMMVVVVEIVHRQQRERGFKVGQRCCCNRAEPTPKIGTFASLVFCYGSATALICTLIDGCTAAIPCIPAFIASRTKSETGEVYY